MGGSNTAGKGKRAPEIKKEKASSMEIAGGMPLRRDAGVPYNRTTRLQDSETTDRKQ
jgi:hypothetical protein